MKAGSPVKDPYKREADDVVRALRSDPEKGLDTGEVDKRREKYGWNRIKEKKQRSLFKILLDQMKSPVIYLLAAAAALSFVFGDIPEGIAIIVVIVINAGIGFWMEYQARQSIQALKKMDVLEVRVVRSGEESVIDANELVPGDIVIAEQGNLIAADARLIESSELQVNEAALTGESVPVDKNIEPLQGSAELAERTNMIFKGTVVTKGKAKAIVTGTGMQTELGSISGMVMQATSQEIPLNKKLNALTNKLIWVTLALAALLGVTGLVIGKDWYTVVQTSIAWAIAAIPEGLPVVASIALARGMLRLADKNVVVKRLASVETLGETNVIFTDKTGTLTENRLSVEQICTPDTGWETAESEELDLSGDDPSKNTLLQLLKVGILCNDAQKSGEGNDDEDYQGDPLEIALLKFAEDKLPEKKQEFEKMERVAEDPFDSESKLMGTVHKETGGDAFFISCKGAAESVLGRCTQQLKDGEEVALDEEEKKKWIEQNDKMSDEGLRVLAFAMKVTGSKPEPEQGNDDQSYFLKELVFTGLIGFLDPPAKEVKHAIETSKKAGIKVIMVTGDHPGTAANIAGQTGLLEEKKDGHVLTGKDMDNGDHKEKGELTEAVVFSRMAPEQKLKLIETYQGEGYIVAMTGDGVNDAPALKKASIGIAMGKRGTEAAKEVADMVLKDDAFGSIVTAIREGRIIFGNIRKFVVYQLSYHLGEILVIAAVSFSLFELPLLPLQLLFLNILTDVFPALALGIGKGKSGVMDEKPKKRNEPVIQRQQWVQLSVYGFILAVFISGGYFFARYSWGQSFEVCNNVALFSLAIAQLLHVLDMRDQDEPVFLNQVTRNKFIWMALGLCAAILATVYFIPSLRELLSLQLLPFRIWMLIIVSALSPLIVIQVFKAFKVVR